MSTLSKTINTVLAGIPDEDEFVEPVAVIPSLDAFREGRDEMNLIELPLSSVSDRSLHGRKTVVLADEIWDRKLKRRVTREVAVSGSDRYGLPTAQDEDVLLACIQLASAQNFRHREVSFSRYQLLSLLRWPDEGRYYQRLSASLRRWKGVTIYSTRAFYDHAGKEWVNRDFGVFDNLYIYERDSAAGGAASSESRFLWNEVLFASFQSGYVKKLDWDLYCRLSSPVAKRLYRLLDKRFYYGNEVVMDLRQLAFRKVRLSDRYNVAQIKRALAAGIRELEERWELRPMSDDHRYVKRGRGQWEIVFERRRPPGTKAAVTHSANQSADLTVELTRRQIGPAMAAELVNQYGADSIRTMMRLFDWYASRGEAKGPGFLVDSIRNPAKYRLPAELKADGGAAKRPEHVTRRRSAPTAQRCEDGSSAATMAFREFWNRLGPDRRAVYETAAVAAAGPLARDGYLRTRPVGGPAFEEYRQLVLREHFRRMGDDQNGVSR